MENNENANSGGNPKNAGISDVKMNAFFKTIITHNTTIIAVVMSVISIISTGINDDYDDAQFLQEQAMNDSIEITNAYEELSMEEDELSFISDTLSEEYKYRREYFDHKLDSLTNAAQEYYSKLDKSQVLLEGAHSKQENTDYAKSISEIAVLLSAVGASNKKKFLLYTASILTIICIILVLFTFLI
jgi:hypothetical protein